MKPMFHTRFLFIIAGSSLMAVSSSSAAIVNWEGDLSTTWTTAGNWDTLPSNDLTTDIANFNLVTYGGNPVFAPTIDSTTSIAGITIGASNGTMTLTTGDFLTIGASGISIANGAGAFTINGSTTLGAAQTWINNSANNFTFGAVSNGTNLLTIGGSGNAIATGDIGSGSSSGGLTKQGAGRLTLQAASTRTGATVIDGGTLRIENATAFGTTAAAITINNGGTFELGTSTTIAATTSTGTINLNNGGTISSGLAGASARIDKTINLEASATGVFTFDSGSNASNVLTINGGSNSRLAGGATGAQIQITGSGIVDVGETGQTRTTAVIADWYLQSGRLRMRADTEIGAAANDFYFQGGTFLTDGAFTLGASRVLNFNHASGGTVDTTGGNLTLGTAGQLNGANRLTKAGTNSLIISANNTGFSGGVTLNGGIVQVNSAQALGTSGNLTFTGGTLQYTASSAAGDDYSARIKNSSSAIILDSNGQTISLAGIIDNTNVAGLTKTGTGTVQLSGANTYTGTTTLTQGTLSLDFTSGNNRINSGNALTLNGGTLQLTNLGTNTQTFGTTTLNSGTASSITRSGTYTSGVSDLGTLSGSGTLDVSNLTASPSWIMASGNASQTFLLNGQVTANSGASFVRTDASGNLFTVTTSDFANNAIIGNNAGTSIRLVTGGSTGTGPTVSGFVGLSTVGTTDFDSILNRYTTGTVTIDVTNSGVNASNILRMGSYGLMFSSSGAALTIGTDVANGGILTAGGVDNTAGTIYVNGSNNTTINSVIQNNGTGVVGLYKDGSGTLTLAGANTYTGGTTVNAGTLLAITTSTSLTPPNPLGGGAITLNGSGTILQLRASGTLNTTAETIEFNNNVTVGGDATIDINRPGLTSTTKTIQLGTLNIGANTLGVTGGNNYSLRFNGATTLTGNATLNVANIYNNNPSLILAGAVGDGSAGYSLTKTGAGMLALSGTNTFSGGVFINAGVLRIASAANLGDSANVVTFTGAGTLESSSTTTLTQGFVINPSVTGTLYAYDRTVTIDNSLSGSGTLKVSGGGTGGGFFAFTSNNNTFSGNIEINSASGASYAGGLTLISLADTPGSRIKMSNTGIFSYGAGAVAPLVFNNRQIESAATAVLNNNATNVNCTVTVNTDLILSGGVGNRNLTLGGSNTGNNTFAGAITNGAGYVVSLTKANAGNWILSNANNSYTGATTINGGTLSVSKMENYGVDSFIGKGTSGVGIAFGGGALVYTGTGDNTNRLVQTSGGNGTILNNGTGALNFTATGNFNVQETTTTARTLSLGGTNGGTISGVIQNNTGTGPALNLTKIGTGTWTLAGANSYTGLTTVSGGTLALSGSGTLGNGTGGLTMSGGSLNLGGLSRSVAAVSVTGAAASGDTIGNGSLTGTSYAASNTTGNAIISANLLVNAAAGFTKTGAGTVTLSGANTYTGSTTLTAGNTQVGVDSVGSVGSITSSALGTGTLTFNGGGISSDGTTARTILNAITFTGNATLGDVTNTGKLIFAANASLGATRTLTVNSTAEFSGIISGATFGITKAGLSDLILSGANSYTGATSINAGTLVLDLSTGSLNSATALTGTANTSGGTFLVKGASSGSSAQTVGAWSTGNNTAMRIVIDPNGGTGTTLTLGDAWTVGSASSMLIDYSSASAGTRQVITANATTGTTLSNGLYGRILVKDSNGVVGFATRAAGSNQAITRFDDTAGTTLVNNSNVAATNFTTLNTVYTSGTLNWSNAITTRSVNSLTIDTTNNGGIIDMGAATNTLTVTSGGILFKGGNNATLTGGQFTAGYHFHVTGSNTLTVNTPTNGSNLVITKDGTGTLVLGGNSTTTGTIGVNEGTLKLGAAGNGTNTPLGTTGQNTRINTGATLDLGGITLSTAEALTLYGTGVSGNGALINSGAAATWSGLITLGSDASIVSNNNIALSNVGTITGAGFNLTLGGTASGSSLTSIIGTTTGGVTKTGTGTWTLNGANTYTGGTTISVGTLALGHATNTLADTGAVNVNGGTLSIGGNSDTVGAVTLASGSITGSGGTLTGSSYAVQSGSVSAILGGSGTLTKSTVGTVTLTGTNTYTGATNVSNGTLIVNGSISNSSLTTVASGATIGGSGTIGALTVSSGGFINPGNSPGTLDTGNYIQAGLYTAEITGLTPDTQHDQISVTGTVNIAGGSLTTLFSAGTYAANDLIFILLNDGTDAITGTYNSYAQGATVTSYGGFDWQISYTANNTGVGTGTFTGGNDIALIAVIPEPSAALLGALGTLLLFRRRR